MHKPDIEWGMILAGGAGRRAGGADKGLLPGPDDEPMVATIARQMRPQVGRLFISCNRNPEHYARYADGLLKDTLPGFAGPLAGLASFPWRSHPGLLLICPCDTPRLPTGLAPALLHPIQRDPGLQVTYIVSEKQPHYLHALLRTDALATLAEFLASGKRAVRAWYATLACQAVELSGEGDLFRNCNVMQPRQQKH